MAKKTSKTNALLEQAQARFKVSLEAEEKQREREKADLEFVIPENQWDAEAKKARKGDGITPGRPMLSISRLDQPMQLILNQMRSADLGVLIHPVSEEATDDTAETIQGIYRHIERKSRAEIARYWAFARAVPAGRGYYRVLTDWDDEGGDPSDQKIVIKRILHQDGVFLDPSAEEPDFSDGKYAFVVAWMKADEFKRKYPNANAAPSNKFDWEGLRKEAPEWVREDDVLVAEYWYKDFTADSDRDEWTVKRAMVCGWDILEKPVGWPGKWIPIVPVFGREVQPYSSERMWNGIVRPARDGQKLHNFAASSAVEAMSIEPKTPFIGSVKAIAGYEKLWQQANIKNYSVLPFNDWDAETGQPIQRPERAQVDGSRMQLSLQVLQMSDQFIQAATAIFEPSLGRLTGQEQSGRQVLALQQQADAATGHFLQNLADISMTYEAKIILDLIPKIYDRQGRITRMIYGDDKKSKPVMLGQPFVMDPQSKRPMPIPQNQPIPENAKTYNLAEGVYDVSVSVGKSYQTRLDEGSDKIWELMTQRPELFMMMGDIALGFTDWPGASEMADRMKKIIEKQMPGVMEGEDGQPTPEQMMGIIQQLQQQLQAGQAQMQAMAKALETEQVKRESQEKIAQMGNETKLTIAQDNNQTKLALEQMSAKMGGISAMLEKLMSADQREHESSEAELDRDHDVEMEVVKSELTPPPMQFPQSPKGRSE